MSWGLGPIKTGGWLGGWVRDGDEQLAVGGLGLDQCCHGAVEVGKGDWLALV